MELTYIDPLPAWDDAGNFQDFSPVPAAVDVGSIQATAPKKSLADSVGGALASIGQKSIDVFAKTADIFGTTLGAYAQGKAAWETIFNPSSANKATNPQAQSQIPSLQGEQSTLLQYQNWLNLSKILKGINVSAGADNLTTTKVPTIPWYVLALVAGVGVYFLAGKGAIHANK